MDKANQWLTLLTNIGVLLGLVVLIYEINQNNVALENETDVAIYAISAENILQVIENSELRELLIRAEDTHFEDFSRSDQIMLGTYWAYEIHHLNLQFRLHQRNNAEFDNIVFYKSDLTLRPFQTWWSRAQINHTKEFIDFVDLMIAKATKNRKVELQSDDA